MFQRKALPTAGKSQLVPAMIDVAQAEFPEPRPFHVSIGTFVEASAETNADVGDETPERSPKPAVLRSSGLAQGWPSVFPAAPSNSPFSASTGGVWPDSRMSANYGGLYAHGRLREGFVERGRRTGC